MLKDCISFPHPCIGWEVEVILPIHLGTEWRELYHFPSVAIRAECELGLHPFPSVCALYGGVLTLSIHLCLGLTGVARCPVRLSTGKERVLFNY
jgi:hypothetical protein